MNLKNVTRILASKFDYLNESDTTKQEQEYADQLFHLIDSGVHLESTYDLSLIIKNKIQTTMPLNVSLKMMTLTKTSMKTNQAVKQVNQVI